MLPWLANPPSDDPTIPSGRPLAKIVRDDMLVMNLRGELAPAQRINEPDGALRLGISRVPVREALRELEITGLVVARKHAGVFVHEPDAEEVRDLYEMHGLYDGFAGRRAARLDGETRKALADVLDASIANMLTAFPVHDVQHYYRENLNFRCAMRASIAEHTRITRALRKGDVARCEDRMSGRVGDAYDRLQGSDC